MVVDLENLNRIKPSMIKEWFNFVFGDKTENSSTWAAVSVSWLAQEPGKKMKV